MNLSIDILNTTTPSPPLTTPESTEPCDLCSAGSVRRSLPGYHLEDKLKDFLWVINKICGRVSAEGLAPSPLCRARVFLGARLSWCCRLPPTRAAETETRTLAANNRPPPGFTVAV